MESDAETEAEAERVIARLAQLGPIDPEAAAFAMATIELLPLGIAERKADRPLRSRLTESTRIRCESSATPVWRLRGPP